MSSFLTEKHLHIMLGQNSPLEQAWKNYYGLELLSDGMMILPFVIEQFYPHIGTTEWELAVIRMIISCSDLLHGPVTSFQPQNFAERFHLSLRQIRRKFKAMVEKGLISITPCYDDNGKKTTFRYYDINPFLDKIFACIRANDDVQQRELLEGSDIDDLDMLPTNDVEVTSMSPDITSYPGTSMSPDTTSYPGTSMSSHADITSGTSMSSHADITSGTSMSPDQPTSYAHTHMYAHTPDSNSSSNSNINTCINKLDINSNSNSNSNRATLQYFDAEDKNNTRLSAACPDESQANEDVRMSSAGDFFEQVNSQNDTGARFERWILHAIEQADEVDKQTSRADKPADAQAVDGLATLPTMLPTRSREALALISKDLHDAQLYSSRGRALRLYNQFLTINQAADVYVMSDPDLSFSELMLAVKHHIRNQTFRNRDHDGQPNGMPLFFYELRKRVEDQVLTVETLLL